MTWLDWLSRVVRNGVVLCLIALLVACSSGQEKSSLYEPTWESLDAHPVPDWYTDAKFGIFIHWGVYSVPAFHEWYVVFMSPKARFGRNLGGPPYIASKENLPDSVFRANIREEALQYHLANYGADFAYDDFIPMFQAEHFQPEEWANLFKQAGARYVVLTAKHGEEFALWPTEYTPRNAMDMGPQRDLVGDLTRAVRAEDLKMGYYHNTTYSFWDERYPEKEWVEYMNNSVKELIDRYHPDVLWGDVVVGPVRDENGEPLGADHWNTRELLAYFYNNSPQPDEVVANDRWGLDKTVHVNSSQALAQSVWSEHAGSWGFPVEGALLGDYQTPERRNVGQIFDFPWETCDALDPTSWGYNKRLPEKEYMTTDELVDYLVDIVSKNGNLLINIGPRADGTIPEVMQERLRGIGNWLRIHGESIYGTQPWRTFREGDVRFTRKGSIVYATAVRWPGQRIVLQSLTQKDHVSNVTLLGSNQAVEWSWLSDGLEILLPDTPPSPYANTLKIECDAG